MASCGQFLVSTVRPSRQLVPRYFLPKIQIPFFPLHFVQNLGSSERSSFFSLLTSGSALGTLLTGIIGSFLLDYFGWQMAFRIIGFFGIVWALFMRFYAMNADRNRVINVSMPNRLTTNNTAVMPCVPWLQIFQRSSFWSMVIAHACQNNCFFVLLSWLPTYFHEGFPQAKVRFLSKLFVSCELNH